MNKINKIIRYFSKTEIFLWSFSVLAIIISFAVFDRTGYLNLAASLVGVTSLIFCAKGHPLGQVLMIIFSIFYGIISFVFGYYGEMITYLGMTAPMAAVALAAWMRHPYNGKRSEVQISRLTKRGIVLMAALTAAVTVVFYFILKALGTVNLLPSTLSVTTSFAAVYLTFKRSAFYALVYAANDAVLIILWALAATEKLSYISVTVCFAAFLINDLYGFVNWLRMRKRQKTNDITAF